VDFLIRRTDDEECRIVHREKLNLAEINVDWDGVLVNAKRSACLGRKLLLRHEASLPVGYEEVLDREQKTDSANP